MGLEGRRIQRVGRGPGAEAHVHRGRHRAPTDAATDRGLDLRHPSVERRRDLGSDLEVAVVHRPHLDHRSQVLLLDGGGPESGHASRQASIST